METVDVPLFVNACINWNQGSIKLGKIGLIKWVDKRQITSTKGLESWRFKCYSLHQFTLIKLICWKPNFHVALSHRHSTTVSLEIKHFFSILLCELSPTSPEVVFIFNAPLIITKALGGLLQAKSHWLRTIKKMFIEMEMVNLGFDGKNYPRIQHNLDNLPQDTVNRNGATCKLSINSRSKITYPSNT